MDCSLPRLLCPWDSPGENIGVGCRALLQGIFLTQGSTIHSKVCLYSSDKLFEMLAPQAMTKKKAMTNLDSVLKSRDITLPTKVHLFKAMVFPVVMYG